MEDGKGAKTTALYISGRWFWASLFASHQIFKENMLKIRTGLKKLKNMEFKMRINRFIVCILMFLLSGFPTFLLIAQESEANSEMNYVTEFGDEATMNWTTKILRVKGNGFGPENIELGRRKILAKRTAKIDAYRNLSEVVKGVQVTSYTNVENMILECDSIKATSRGMLKGMQVVDVTYSNDGGCEITVEVNIDEKGRFLLDALNTGKVEITDNYPEFDWTALKNELKQVRKKYNSLLAAFKKKGEELNHANQKLAHMEERLKAEDLKKSELKTQLTSAEEELESTKNIAVELTNKITHLEMKLTANEKELKMTKTFLSEKKRELDKLLAATERLKKAASQDQVELLGYLQRIIEIQQEIREKLGAFDGEKPIPPPPPTPSYTGLLVDARGLNLEPTLAPSILNQNSEKMYGIGVIPKKVTSGAIVDYLVGNIERAKKHKKIADRPMVAKGIEVVNESDIMISNEDARKLVLIHDLLEQKKVAILHKER